jgi:tetratricopeptide (TPR) repeat protein
MLLPDLTRTKSPKRRILFWTMVALAIGIAFSARPVYSLVKKRRAASLAQQGQLLISQKKGDEALAKLQSALQMNPGDLQANYGMAQLLTLSRRAEAFHFWQIVFSKGGGNAADRLEATKLAIFLKQLDFAEVFLSQILKDKPVQTETLRLAAIYCDLKNESVSAIHFARAYLETNPEAAEIRFLLVRHLLRTQKTDDEKEAKGLLWKSLRDGGRDAPAAIQLLATAQDLSAPELRELINALEKLPANDATRLLKTDLETRLLPEAKDQLISKAVAEAKSSPEKFLNVCRWLSQKREFGRVEKILPLNKALESKDLFTVYVDALAALGRWNDLESVFNQKSLPLEPVLAELYRARIDGELKKDARAKLHWEQALSLAGQNSEALANIGGYAERIGAWNPATKAYEALVKDPAQTRAAYQGLVRIAEKTGDTMQLRNLMKSLLLLYPKDPAPQNDLAYLNLLLKSDIDTARHIAENLVKEHPQTLAYRTTLALALMRNNKAAEAKKSYDGISFNWAEALPGWQAVYTSVLGASGDAEQARKLARSIDRSRLKPEEREIIQPWLN